MTHAPLHEENQKVKKKYGSQVVRSTVRNPVDHVYCLRNTVLGGKYVAFFVTEEDEEELGILVVGFTTQKYKWCISHHHHYHHYDHDDADQIEAAV